MRNKTGGIALSYQLSRHTNERFRNEIVYHSIFPRGEYTTSINENLLHICALTHFSCMTVVKRLASAADYAHADTHTAIAIAWDTCRRRNTF